MSIERFLQVLGETVCENLVVTYMGSFTENLVFLVLEAEVDIGHEKLTEIAKTTGNVSASSCMSDGGKTFVLLEVQ